MRKFFLFAIAACSLFAVKTASAQDTSSYPYWKAMMQDPKANFNATVSAFNQYYANRKHQKGDGWKVFKRWESFWKDRLDENGYRISTAEMVAAYREWLDQTGTIEGSTGQWTQLGPVVRPVPNGQPTGMGRVNAIGFDPNPLNNQIIYAGTPQGGLWKTTNRGTSWTALTDQLPSLGVSTIAVDYSNSNRIYIGTGDRDADDSQGAGIWKSNDGGLTWAQSSAGIGNVKVAKILINPNDSSTLIAATENGIWRSTDFGATWIASNLRGIFIKDMVFNPANPNIVYATGNGTFIKSTDNGRTWSSSATGIAAHYRMCIAVTPANPNYVYVVAANASGYDALYRSTDGGNSFTIRSQTTPNILDWSSNGSGAGGQSWYDLDIAADPEFKDIIYVGGINIWKSLDGGATWNIVAHWVGAGAPAVHADHHILEFDPYNKDLFNGCDGGIYYTSNGGTSWNSLSDGLRITQIYKIGQSATNTNIVHGNQDNGTYYKSGNNWVAFMGGDGMECAVDYTNSNYVYGEVYYGDMNRSTDGGQSSVRITSSITTEEGDWVTPFELHRTNPNTMFLGYKNLWRATNVKTAPANAVNWTPITTGAGAFAEDNIKVIEQSIADPNILYYSNGRQHLARSNNVNAANPTWVSLANNLPSIRRIFDIATNPKFVNQVTIIQNNRVWQSNDQGLTWTDISGTLPRVKMNCLMFDTSTYDGLYLGTDVGVFYKDSNTVNWIPYTMGLPASSAITEIEIYHAPNRANSLLRASTYGRGIWESPLFSISAPPVATFRTSNNDTVACTGFPLIFKNVSANYPKNLTWTFTPNTVTFINGTSSRSQQPQVVFNAPGTYTVKLVARNSFGVDSIIKPNYITVMNGPSIPLVIDFDGNNSNYYQTSEDQFDFSTRRGLNGNIGTGPLADHTTGNGNYLVINSFTHNIGDTAAIVSNCFDITGMINPTLDFYYSNFGLTCGTIRVEVNDRSGWRTVWEASGNGNRTWKLGRVALNRFSGILKFRISASVAGTNGDLAIDDIKVYDRAIFRDAAVLQITSPTSSGCGFGSTAAVSVMVKNTGTTIFNALPLSYSINGGTPVSETLIRVLNPGDSAVYTFTTPANLSTAGIYQISAAVTLATDQDPSNDQTEKLVTAVNQVQTPQTLSDSVCLFSPANLRANSSADSIFWYSISDTNKVIGKGNPFNAGVYQFSQIFYARAVNYGDVYTGLTDVSRPTDTLSNTSAGILFDVLSDAGITLKTIRVYADRSGDSANIVVSSKNGQLSNRWYPLSSGWNTVNLNVYLPSDTGYSLSIPFMSGNLHLAIARNEATFPYTVSNSILLKNSTLGNVFYPFAFNWKVSYPACRSSLQRADVYVRMNPMILANATTFNIARGNAVNIYVVGATTYQWNPTTGISNPTGSNVMASPTTTTQYQVYGVDEFGCKDTLDIKVNVNVGAKDMVANQLNVYPNPSNGVVTVDIPSNILTGNLSVYNSAGQLIQRKSIRKGEPNAKIDLRSQADGIYLIEISAGNQVFSTRITKQ